MALMPLQDRQRVAAHINRKYPQALGRMNLLKPDVMAVVNAVDQWVDSNTASYLSILPEPFKTNSTAAAKTLVLALCLMRRAGFDLLRVDEDNV